VSDPVEDWLSNKAEIKELPFRSSTRFVGPIIARLRSLWNSVSTKWYVRPMLQQQNEFNRLLVERLRDHDARLIEQDREQTALAHNLAEVTAQLQQTNRLLHAIERRLQRLEESVPGGDEEPSRTS
jgi:hypothetical protein